MHKLATSVLIVCSLLPHVACSDGKFSSDEKTGKSADASAAVFDGESGSSTTTPEVGKVDGGSVSIDKASEKDLAAIDRCTDGWGSIPDFDKDSVRKIAASVSVASAGIALKDHQITEKPQLTLIYAAVNVASDTKWELLNPNGWYCIVSNVNVASRLTVTIDNKTHISDGKAAVNVASRANESLGKASVNVASEVIVIRK